MEFDDEWVGDVRENVPLHLGPLPVAHLEGRLLQHFHRVHMSCVPATDFSNQEHLKIANKNVIMQMNRMGHNNSLVYQSRIY